MKKLSAKPAPGKKQPQPTAQQQHRAAAPVRVTEAPVCQDVHAPKPDQVKQARTRLATEARKQAHEALVADLVAGRKALTPDTVSDLTQKDIATIAKAKGWKGYSGLTTTEGRQYLLNSGEKPAVAAGTTRALREVVAQAKRDGKVTGPVSSLKVEALKKVAAQVQAGQTVTVAKPAANEGTMGYNQNLLRNTDGKGYKAEYTAKAKAMFGKSISALKAAEVKALCQALGLVK